MKNVCEFTTYNYPASKCLVRGICFVFLSLLLFSLGCSQSVDSVAITPVSPSAPTTYTYISHTALEGASTTQPISATRSLGVHSFGGPNMRVQSASASFSLTGGIGVD